MKVARGSDGAVFAMKMIEFEDDGTLSQSMLREPVITGDIQHPYIVTLEEKFIHEDQLCLILEFIHLGVEQHRMTYRCQYPQVIKLFMGQIISAVTHCHSLGIVHRDLKLSNLLVDISDTKKPVMKLIDFGHARGFLAPNIRLSPKVGTPNFSAPELLLGSESYTKAVDMWSIGCIFAELMLNGDAFINALDDEAALDEIFSIMGFPDELFWPEGSTLPQWNTLVPPLLNKHHYVAYPKVDFLAAFPDLEPSGADLLMRLLCFDPAKRITAEEASQHAYLNGWEKIHF